MTHPDERVEPDPASAPAVSPAPRRRDTVTRTVRLVALVVVLALAVLVVATTVVLTGPPSKRELMERAGLVGKRELLIGVKDDQPGIAMRDGDVYSGFDIEIARMIAADLGFRPSQIRFYAIESEDRRRRQAIDKNRDPVTVDLVIASYSITPEREADEGVTFSAPYLSTEQSVVTREDYPGNVSTLQDLRGRKVCSLSTATSEDAPGLAGVELHSKKRISECVAGLRAGDFDAVTTDAAILAGFVAQYPGELRSHDIGLDSSERWGVNTGGNEPLRDLVNLTLYRSLTDPQDRRWEDAFDRYLRPVQEVNKPQPIASDQQPHVDEVEVRQWPWETAASTRPGTEVLTAGRCPPAIPAWPVTARR